MKSLTSKVLAEFTRDATAFGGVLFSYIVALIFLMWGIPAILVGLLLVDIIGQGIKAILPTTRPDKEQYHNVVEKMRAGSFPSVHAARSLFLAFMVYGITLSIPVGVVAALLAIAVGVSRVLLKRHYIKDVVGGYVLGLLVFFLYTRVLA